MSERIAYQFNCDHVLKFAGMQKLTGEQVADELNRLYTIIAEQNEKIAALEREVERLKKDAARLRPALEETVKSLEIISQQAGESRGLSTFTQIKQYALDWVRTARKDLAAGEAG